MSIEKRLIPSLFQSIKNDGALDLFKDYAELGLDSFIDDEVIKSIPIFNSLSNTVNCVLSLRELIMMKKLTKFLYSSSNISEDERVNFMLRMEKSPELLEEVGEKLIIALERADAVGKATLIGKMFKAYICNEISFSDLSMLINGINRAHMEHLEALLTGKSVSSFDEVNEGLYFAGFKRMMISTTKDSPMAFPLYTTNHLGDLLIKYGG